MTSPASLVADGAKTGAVEDEGKVSEGEASASDQECFDNFERLRREKRLRLNRESARARRNRNKTRMETLEREKEELISRNRRFVEANQALRAKVQQLEADLAIYRSALAAMGKKAPTVAAVPPPVLPTLPNSQILSQEAIRNLAQGPSIFSSHAASTTARSLADKMLAEKIFLDQAILDSSSSSSSRMADPSVSSLGQLRPVSARQQPGAVPSQVRNASIENLVSGQDERKKR